MITFSEALYQELEHELLSVEHEDLPPLDYARRGIQVSRQYLDRLKTALLAHQFDNAEAEIAFFREVKPRFVSQLIYFNALYRMESNRPIGSKKALIKYYRKALDGLVRYFEEEKEFYRYYRTGDKSLDAKYFLRAGCEHDFGSDDFYLAADNRFATLRDFDVARIIANDAIAGWIEKTIMRLEAVAPKALQAPLTQSQKWTAPKVALVELIYALHAEGAFNNGSSDIKEIAALFESAFGIELGHYYRTFLEIRERKTERTKFLSGLAEQLIRRMDAADAK